MILTFDPDYSFGKIAGVAALIAPSKLMICLISMIINVSGGLTPIWRLEKYRS
jgi:hypothetical protein